MPVERVFKTNPRQGVEIKPHTSMFKDTMIHIYVENPDGSFPANPTSVHGFNPDGSGLPGTAVLRALAYSGINLVPDAEDFIKTNEPKVVESLIDEWRAGKTREQIMSAIWPWVRDKFMPWLCSLLNRNVTAPVDPDTGTVDGEFMNNEQITDAIMFGAPIKIGPDGRATPI